MLSPGVLPTMSRKVYTRDALLEEYRDRRRNL